MPASTDNRRRTTGRPEGTSTTADDVRRAAFQAATAARRLHTLTDDPLWRPKMLTAATLADLRDARDRLDAVLQHADTADHPAPATCDT